MDIKKIKEAVKEYNTNYRYLHVFSFLDNNFVNSINVYRIPNQTEFDLFISKINDNTDAFIDILGNTTAEKGLGLYILVFDEIGNTITIFSLSYLLTVYKESLDNIERCIEYVDMMNPIKDWFNNVSGIYI